MNEADLLRRQLTQAHAIGERLAVRYRHICETSMRDVPICNSDLQVESIGFRPFGPLATGIVITPWFMNLVAAPLPEDGMTISEGEGEFRRLQFPSGNIDFIVGTLGDFGPLLSTSLFSPVFEFETMDGARQVAVCILTMLFEPGADLHPAPVREVDRRSFLRARVSGGAEP